jgi:hypothetical protein
VSLARDAPPIKRDGKGPHASLSTLPLRLPSHDKRTMHSVGPLQG